MAFTTAITVRHPAILRVSASAHAEDAAQENACVQQQKAKKGSGVTPRSPRTIKSIAITSPALPLFTATQALHRFGSHTLSETNFG